MGKIGISNSIKLLRIAHGLTQNELAKKTGFTQTYISRIESGHRGPSFNALKRLIEALGVSVSEFRKVAEQVPDRAGAKAVHLVFEVNRLLENSK